MKLFIYLGKCSSIPDILFSSIETRIITQDLDEYMEELNSCAPEEYRKRYSRNAIKRVDKKIYGTYFSWLSKNIYETWYKAAWKRHNDWFFTLDDKQVNVFRTNAVYPTHFITTTQKKMTCFFGELIYTHPCNRHEIEIDAWKNLKNRAVWMVYADWLQDNNDQLGKDLMTFLFSAYS